MKGLTPAKLLRAILATALVMAALVGIVVTFFPDLTTQVMGYDMRYRLQKGEESDLALVLKLTRASEIIGEGVKPSDQIPGDILPLNIRLYEKIQSPGRETNIDYEVREMRREETGKGMKGKLGAEPFTLRVPVRGGISEVTRMGTAKDEIMMNGNFGQFGLLMWPLMPSERLREDTKPWSGAFPIKMDILGEEIEVTHRLEYQLDGFKRFKGKDYAHITFDGYLDPKPLKAGLKVTGQGTMKGLALIDLATTRNTLAAYNIKQDYLLELKGARYRFYEDQDLQFFRGKTPEEVQSTLQGPSPSPEP
jgi:hypothetical protein